jgi:hypothetical protein
MYIPHVLRGMTNAIGAVNPTCETFSSLCRLETLLDAKFASFSPHGCDVLHHYLSLCNQDTGCYGKGQNLYYTQA